MATRTPNPWWGARRTKYTHGNAAADSHGLLSWWIISGDLMTVNERVLTKREFSLHDSWTLYRKGDKYSWLRTAKHIWQSPLLVADKAELESAPKIALLHNSFLSVVTWWKVTICPCPRQLHVLVSQSNYCLKFFHQIKLTKKSFWGTNSDSWQVYKPNKSRKENRGSAI